jgi:chromate transporter
LTPVSASGDRPSRIFLIFLRLGLTSFGGPVAHLGYFRDEFVGRRRWLDERAYADLVALCQFLPGPASSQVGLAIGLARGGFAGALAAWTGFTLPSALLMVACALGFGLAGEASEAGWLAGLKVAAVAVVAHAVWSMGRVLTPDPPRLSLAVAAAALVLAHPSVVGQVAAIALGALAGLALRYREDQDTGAALDISVRRSVAIACLVLFALLLLTLPLAVVASGDSLLGLFDSFYRAGALVFGGGHVVLPLLKAETVPALVSEDVFLAGYGAAQAVPGPLFTFAAYLGAAMTTGGAFWLTALIALVAIFLPSFLLVGGILPFWESLRRRASARAALTGVNAAVVGLLLAALYDPVWRAGIRDGGDFALLALCLLLLAAWRWPSWAVVGVAALGGALIAALPDILAGS